MSVSTEILGIPISHLCIELGVYAMFVFQCLSTWKTPRWIGAGLSLAGFAYALEYMGSLQPETSVEAMHYGRFLVMLPSHTPLWIVLGWVVLMMAAMRNAERMGGSFFIKPVVVGLLAMGFSLSMDPIAVFSGWYQWYIAGPYFGVPSDHAVLYFGCAFFQSLLLWTGWRVLGPDAKPWLRNLLFPALASLLSLVAVTLYSSLVMKLYAWGGGTEDITGPPWTGQSVVSCLLFGVVLGSLFFFRKEWNLYNEVSWSTFAVPVFFFPLFLLICVLGNAYHRRPEMPIAVTCNNLFMTLVWAAPSFWSFMGRSANARASAASLDESPARYGRERGLRQSADGSGG